MRRVMVVLMVSGALAGCPSTARNRPADATAEAAAGDVVEERAVGDGDVVDVSDADAGDAADVGDASEAGDAAVDAGDADAGNAADAGDAGGVGMQMTIEFSSAALVSAPDGGVQMRANITWHGALRGDAGGITFEGEIR